MKNLRNNIILGLIICTGILSCTDKICKLPDGNMTSELLASVSRQQNYNYCILLDAALKGNNDSIRKLSMLDFSDAAGYDHGAVIIEVIREVGDTSFINAIITTSKVERTKIEGYLDVGLMYGFRKEYEDKLTKPLKEVYPKIYSFLND